MPSKKVKAGAKPEAPVRRTRPERPPVGEPELDDNYNAESRQAQRAKQIQIGKSTRGYRNYRRRVPRAEREEGEHLDTPPASPRTNAKVSKRMFEACLREWRRYLHDYDDLDSDEGEWESDGEDEVARPQSPPTVMEEMAKRLRGTEVWLRTKKRRGGRGKKQAESEGSGGQEKDDGSDSQSISREHSCSGGGDAAPPQPLVQCWQCISAKHFVREGASRSAGVVGTVVQGDIVSVIELHATHNELWGRLGFPEGSWTLLFDTAAYFVELPPPPPPPPGPRPVPPTCCPVECGAVMEVPHYGPVPAVSEFEVAATFPSAPLAPAASGHRVCGPEKGDTPFSSLEEMGIFLARPPSEEQDDVVEGFPSMPPPPPLQDIDDQDFVSGFPSAPVHSGLRRSASQPNLFDTVAHEPASVAQTPAY
eukprot:Hpha_TRINITY_DN14556_c0_g1::TRINITY_DN14556_c0_g1_i1::g.46916::m.46916